jgi:hypothetical protein
MRRTNKSTLRAAAAIHAHLTRSDDLPLRVNLPAESWQHLERLVRLTARAQRSGFPRAACRLLADLGVHAERLHRQLNLLAGELRQSAARPTLPSIAELHRDLAALEREFDEAGYDSKTGRLWVRTGNIELRGVILGPFRIELHWSQQDGIGRYRVIALKPHPTAEDEGVTHPHVKNDRLCEGEGHAAIRAALTQGRLYDFFLLVGQVLETYSPGNAYVDLDQWHGQACSDCGANVSDHAMSGCDACEATLCGDCQLSCGQCHDGLCAGCVSSCVCCQSDCCRACRSACGNCAANCCPSCLENGQCTECRAQGDPDNGHNQSKEQPANNT